MQIQVYQDTPALRAKAAPNEIKAHISRKDTKDEYKLFNR